MPDERDLQRADARIIDLHEELDAAAGHVLIARHIWAALRGLGVEDGTMLAVGDHATAYLGVPGSWVAGDYDNCAPYREKVADIPPLGPDGIPPWPHDDLRNYERGFGRPYGITEPVRFDVIVASAQHADLAFWSQHAREAHHDRQVSDLTGALNTVRAGGLVAAVLSHQILDDPDWSTRAGFGFTHDLLGALRLPATFLRPRLDPQHAAPIDLLLWRRRLPGEEPTPTPFTRALTDPAAGHSGAVNEHYTAFPERVLGTPTTITNPEIGTTRYTVLGGETPIDHLLGDSLAAIVRAARTSGLTQSIETPEAAQRRKQLRPPGVPQPRTSQPPQTPGNPRL